MSELSKKTGWIILTVSMFIGCAVLYYTPRSVQTRFSEQQPAQSTSERAGINIPPPIGRHTSYKQYLPGANNDPFRPPRRWRSVTPETPGLPPLPDLKLPDPVFVLPTPPSGGPNWSTLQSQINASNADVTIEATDFGQLAEQAKSASETRSNNNSIEDQFRTFDRIYLKDEEKWLNGTITDKSEYFITFRNRATGKSRQFSVDNVRTEPARDPVASLREEMEQEKPLSNLERMNELITRAKNLGMMEDAASLVESYINNQLPNLSLYRRAAKLYQHAGKPEQALRLLDEATNSNTVETHELLFLTAQIQWDTGLRERAIKTLKKSIDKHPLFIRARLLQFLYLMERDNPSRAAEQLEKLRMETSGTDESKPKRLLYRFAQIYFTWSYQDRTRARQFIEQLPEPSDAEDSFSFAWPQVFAFRSRLHLENGQLEQALEILREGIEHRPASYALWNNLGVVALLLENSSLAERSFSVCEYLAPYRVQHRLARSYMSTTDSESEFGAVRTDDNTLPIAYHNALNSIQPDNETSDSSAQTSDPGNSDTGTGDNGVQNSSGDVETSSEPAPPGGSATDDRNDTSNTGSFSSDTTDSSDPTDNSSSSDTPDQLNEGPSKEQSQTGKKTASISPVESGTVAEKNQSEPSSPLEGFKPVYKQNTSFTPGAIGLGYAHVKNKNTATGRSLLFQYGKKHWLSQYVIARSYIQDDHGQRALDYLNEVVDAPDDPVGAAYFKTLKAYLMLENGRTRQAGTTLESISEAPDSLSDYRSTLRSIIDKSEQMRELTDSFERPGDDSSIGGDWTRNTQDTGISILQKSGYISFEGTLRSEYPFPRIERPTNENFVSAEFSVEITEQAENLFIGIGILNAGSDSATGPIAAGVTPLTPDPKLYTLSGSLAHLNTWNELQSPDPERSIDTGNFTIRLGRRDTSSDATWYASVSGQNVAINQYAPELPADSTDLSVVFFVSGPDGTPIDLQLNDFRLVHEFSK